jgi:hypothetical protein
MYILSFILGSVLGIVYGLWVSRDLPRVFHFERFVLTRFLRFFSIVLIFVYILRQPQLRPILILIVFTVSLWLTTLLRLKARSNGTS